MGAETGGTAARVGAALLRMRWIVRSPIWLYRARLGFLFGSRLLMLEHVGRTSGRRRYVVLEVVDHPVPGRYVVVSGFGTTAQWFRNVLANRQVRISVGARASRPAVAHQLDAPAGSAALARYADRHPRAWNRLRPVLEHTLGAPVDDAGTALPLVALDLVDEQ